MPGRLIIVGLPATAGNVHTMLFEHQALKNGVHAYDYLTSWDQAVAAADAIAPGDDLLVNLIAQACGPEIGPQADDRDLQRASGAEQAMT